MCKPFINYTAKYFPNAVVAVDSFHVVHWIINEIHKYIRAITRQYLKRDQELHTQRETVAMRELTMHKSDEVYILKKYSWLVLTNQENIDYSQEMKIDSHFRYFMPLYEKEEKLFALVPELREMRDLKEFYIRFNVPTSMISSRLKQPCLSSLHSTDNLSSKCSGVLPHS